MHQNLGDLIIRTPGIVGGRPRINGTRMSVQTIAGWYKQGYSVEEIADQYEHLTLAQIYAALAYYHANQEEIEADLRAEETLYDQLSRKRHAQKKTRRQNTPIFG